MKPSNQNHRPLSLPKASPTQGYPTDREKPAQLDWKESALINYSWLFLMEAASGLVVAILMWVLTAL